MEGALRAAVKPSAVLLVHHALFFVLLCAGLWLGPSALLIKLTVVLDLGAVHELPLYVALLLYRRAPAWVAVRGCARSAGLSWRRRGRPAPACSPARARRRRLTPNTHPHPGARTGCAAARCSCAASWSPASSGTASRARSRRRC
jgi:hypothetical protein